MGRKRRTSRQKTRARSVAPERSPQPGRHPSLTRRDTLRWIRNGTLAVVAMTGSVYIGVRGVNAHTNMHDLSRIGQGVPMVVQVHDPTCPICNALKRQVRKALKGFTPGTLDYVIADVRTDAGAAYAARHGVPHVTLLLVDGAGYLHETLRGMHQAAELERAFAAHVGRASAR